MTISILNNIDMSSDKDSAWFPSESLHPRHPGLRKVSSVQVMWDSLTGDLDGTLKIYGTNDPNSKSLVATINIDTATNLTNSHIEAITVGFNEIRVEYEKNSILSGILNVWLNYEAIS